MNKENINQVEKECTKCGATMKFCAVCSNDSDGYYDCPKCGYREYVKLTKGA